MSATENLAFLRPESAPELTDLDVSVVIPCLDEASTIEFCVLEARRTLERSGWSHEVLVVDNGSTDGSPLLAERAGARVVHQPERGYGNALRAGFDAAQGRHVVMFDGDLSYPIGDMPRFLEQLEEGADMVVGDRMDSIQPGAMPFMHRYVGNPLLTGLLNLLFRTGVRDAHCGMRAMTRDALARMQLRTGGMELASEMVIRASKEKLVVRQFPIEYRPRGGESKLSSFRDGWRHLRFLLVHSPHHLFIAPGLLLLGLGAVISALVLGQVDVFGRQWEVHTLLAGALLLTLGVQVLTLGVCARAYGVYVLDERDPWLERMRARFGLEHGVIAGLVLSGAGALGFAVVIGTWIDHGLGRLAEQNLAVASVTLVVLGAQVFFASFLLSIIGLRRPAAS